MSKLNVLEDKDLLTAVLAALPAPIFIVSVEGKYLDILGGSDQERFHVGNYFIGKNVSDFFDAEMTAGFLEQNRLAVETKEMVNYVYMIPFDKLPAFENQEVPSGDRWYEANIVPIRKDGESMDMLIWSISDITERMLAIDHLQKQETTLKLQATTDELTQLLNRRGFMAFAEEEVQRVERYRTSDFSMFVLDIDHFKAINDTYGHPAGDAVLASLAECLKQRLRASDRVARIGGEEFAVLLPGALYEQALLVAEQVRQNMENLQVNVEEADSPIRLTVSIGVSNYVIGEGSVDNMMSRADKALYTAKKGGRNRVCGELGGDPSS